MSSTHTHGSLSSTSTHTSISFLRGSKAGKTKGGKDKARDKEQGRKGGQEEWYIPYKGPYEPAPTTGLKTRVSRDSWGDPVPGVDGVDSHQGVDENHTSTAQEAQRQRPRSQSHSSTQNQPNQQPLSLRPSYSSQSPSYINLDAAGGIGNSPVPPLNSSRHMLHVGERPWSARETREGVETPRTLRQRSSLASLFEKKYSLLKKLSLSKLGLGVEGGKEREEVDPTSAEKWEQPPPRPPRQRPIQSQPRDDLDRRDGDITVVPRSLKSKSESVSVYSQPSPFVSSIQPPKSVQQEQKSDKEWVPLVRLTPPPAVHPANVDRSPTDSSRSSLASHQRTLSSADSYSHSRSNSHSAAPVPVPLPPVDEDDSHVESYYDMLITSSVDTPPPTESHPYAYTDSHKMAGKQKTRLSPIPQSRPSLTTLRSVASSPDLRRRGKESEDPHVEGVDIMSRLRPHVREKLSSTGGRGKERWLGTDLIAIFLPKPKFKFKGKKMEPTTDLPIDDTHHLAEFGVQRLSDAQQSSTSRRKSYAYDDLSLLSLDRVLEEGDKLEKDRMKWQAQAVKSLGNRHARIVSRSRSKSLTQAGRKMKSIPGQPPQLPQPQHRYQHTRGQQSSIDYLAARACLGDQDSIPLVDDTVGVDIGTRRPQFDFPKHNVRERHERMPSGSSGLATSSGGHRSSNGVSAQSGSDGQHHHKRNDSWSRSAVRIAKSLPQICGVVRDGDDSDDNEDQNHNKRIQQQPQPLRSLEVITDPAGGDHRKPSPSPSNTSGAGAVGIAISTPPAYRHPYSIGADRSVDGSKQKEDSNGRSASDIKLPDHPYAQGGMSSSSSISRCVAGEREPDYVGPHRAVAVPMTKELMADLGLSELSARHRLPPQVRLAPPLIRLESGSESSEQAAQEQQQKPNQLYVKVDDTRNSYQDLQPFVRVDSNAQPSDRLWVTYSPGTVREVMPHEVFQYSPLVPNQNVAHVAAASTSDTSPVSASSGGTDFFLQRYQRMSTVYQDTVTMSQALGNAMYDSSSQDARRRESAEHQQSTTTEDQLITLRYTATPPPRVLFGPRLNTTPPKNTENLSASRVSSPILPRASPVVFTDPFPRGRGVVSAASPEHSHSSSSTGTSMPTSPTVPRVGSPDNLEPFHGLFYRPPEGSESDSPVPSPSPMLGRVSGPDEEEEEPSHMLLDDGEQWIPRLGGSGVTTLMKDVNDELEQMVLERQREEQRERSGSIRSSNTLQSQRPSTSESASTSTTSKGGTGGGGPHRSRRINTEAGPLDFVLDRSMLPQQDAPTTTYVPRPNRVSTFYPSTPIPEDIEFSRASSPFEGTVEDETVRVPNNVATPPVTTSAPRTYPTEEEYMSMDGIRASYLTTTDTLSRISTLSDFPVPPKGMTPEEISILTAQPR